MSMQYFVETVKRLMKTLDYVAQGVADADDIQRWIDLATSAIEALEEVASTELSRAQKQKCQTCISHLLSIRGKLENAMKRGGELREDAQQRERVRWDDMQSAFKKRIKSGVISNLEHLDLKAFMNDASSVFVSKIRDALVEHQMLKVNAELSAEYIIQKNDTEIAEVKYFNTENATISQHTDLLDWFNRNVKQPIERDMEEFSDKGSGWTLRRILSLLININAFNPMKGSSYIPLPKVIESKKACINVQNTDDNECFKWALLSALHPAEKNANRVSTYRRFESELDFKGIDFPVLPKQITKFEKQNSVSVNLYILKLHGKEFKVSPSYLTSFSNKEKHVNLLLIQDYYVDENEEEEGGDDVSRSPPKFHYVWIKDLSRLVRSQLTKHRAKCHICDRCLHFFRTEEQLQTHKVDCVQLNTCKIVLPSKADNLLKFTNFNRKEKVPYVIYADCECLLKPEDEGERNFQLHQAYSIGYYLKCSFDDARSVYESYRQGDDDEKSPAEWFVEKLQALATELEQLYAHPVPMNLTSEEEENFKSATSCHVCGAPFSSSGNKKKVRDHCHLTGQYRGAAHEGCNLNYQNSRFIPVIFHNLSGYDSHFIINEIATAPTFKGRVSLIAENKERYISFTKHIDGSDINFRFIDSFRFMASSLEKLASYLEHTDIVRRVFQNEDNYTVDQIKLLERKGVFPYEYVSSFEKLKEQRLPPKDDFHSTLNGCDIFDEDYKHAQDVWNAFDIQSLGEYSDLYLKTDVLLLADVFENFRSTCIDAYGLDPAHYYTTPGLTWDAMLKHTGIQLELLTDVDMLMFVEKGIRGGISQCCNRYAKANNEFMNEDYDANEESKYLMYFDVNNLYGWAMTESLPYGGFQWVEDVDEPSFFDIPDDSPVGYILEVDLEYPESIHDDHKDLPLCPEHLAPPNSKQKKLLTTLFDKERYVVHYHALKQALKHGLILKKVHRALQFKQKK